MNKIKKIDKSLEKAAEGWMASDPVDAFIAGAKWDREQMLKDAAEGVVCILPGSEPYVLAKDERDNDTLKQYIIDNFKVGDKVKIVIVKEDRK